MLGHPKGLYMLFGTEMWERFSFLGMRAILVLYIIGKTSNGGLGWTDSEALQLYGTYLGIAYITPLLGGYCADRFLGQQTSVLIGGVLMACGHFLMVSSELWAFYTALCLVALGNGFFKPCITSILGGLYSNKDSRRDSAYSIFYMGINVGGLLGTLIAGWVQVGFNYQLVFLCTGSGMLVGLFTFILGRKKCLADMKKKLPQAEVSKERKSPLTRQEKNRVMVIMLMAMIQVFFVIAYEQGGGLLTIYADQHIDRNLMGMEIPTVWFSGLNPLFIILFAPILSAIWTMLGRKKMDFSFVNKFGIGFLFTGTAYLIMALAASSGSVDPSYKTGALLLIAFYAIYTFGELLIFPVLWSAVSRIAPKRYLSLLMAVALSSLGLGGKLAGTVGSFVDRLGPGQIFAGIMSMMFLLALVCFLINKKIISLTESESEIESQSENVQPLQA